MATGHGGHQTVHVDGVHGPRSRACPPAAAGGVSSSLRSSHRLDELHGHHRVGGRGRGHGGGDHAAPYETDFPLAPSSPPPYPLSDEGEEEEEEGTWYCPS